MVLRPQGEPFWCHRVFAAWEGPCTPAIPVTLIGLHDQIVMKEYTELASEPVFLLQAVEEKDSRLVCKSDHSMLLATLCAHGR